MLRILDVDLDPVYQFDALFLGLDLLGGELGFRGDETDAAFVGLARNIGGNLHGLAEFDAGEIRLIDVPANPWVIDIADGEDGRTGSEDLAGVGGPRLGAVGVLQVDDLGDQRARGGRLEVVGAEVDRGGEVAGAEARLERVR